MPITLLQCSSHGILDLTGRGLPCTYSRVSINEIEHCEDDH
jgi:hypothetical protein